MSESTVPPALPEVLLEQIVDRSDGDEPRSGARRRARIRLYKPVEWPNHTWGCTLEFQSLENPDPPRRFECSGDDSVQALFYALRLAEDMLGRKHDPMLPDVFIERILDYADGDVIRPITVRIYKPVQYGSDKWGCTLEFHGLRPEGRVFMSEQHGCDAVQALFHALRIAEVEIDCHKGQLSWGNYKPWAPVGAQHKMVYVS
jgi:hypothetical protein